MARNDKRPEKTKTVNKFFGFEKTIKNGEPLYSALTVSPSKDGLEILDRSQPLYLFEASIHLEKMIAKYKREIIKNESDSK